MGRMKRADQYVGVGGTSVHADTTSQRRCEIAVAVAIVLAYWSFEGEQCRRVGDD